MSSSGTTGNAANAAENGGRGSTNNNNNSRRPRWSSARHSTTSSSQILNAIPGLEKAIFDFGPHVKPDKFQKSRVAVETHIQSTFKDPRDIIEAMRHLAPPSTLSPPPPPAPKDPAKPDIFELAMVAYKYQYEDYHKRSSQYTADQAKAWAIIYGQCTAALRTQLEGVSTFQTCRDTYNFIDLLTMIECLCSRLGEKQHGYYAVAGTFRALCMYYQPDGMSNDDDYYHHFQSMVRVITKFAGDDALGHLPTLSTKELTAICTANGTHVSTASNAEKSEAAATTREKFCAALMLSGSNVKRYKNLKNDLANSFALGNDNYPGTMMAGVLDLLNNYNPPAPPTCSNAPGNNASRTETIEEQAMFAQNDSTDPSVICRDCNQPGHTHTSVC